MFNNELCFVHFLYRKVKPLFLIGIAPDEKIQSEIKEESVKYNDILQFNLKEGYENIVLKGIGFLDWVVKYCQNAKYIAKFDTDTYTHLKTLIVSLETQEFISEILKEPKENKPIILGYRAHNPNAPGNFNPIPKSQCCKGQVFPDYLSGGKYD